MLLNTRFKLIFFLFILVLIVVVLGNYIHMFFMKRNINYQKTGGYIESNNLAILIEVDKKRLSLVDCKRGEVVKIYGVATGKANSPTPLGTFRIIEKARWGGGFGSRWLGLDVPWGKYGIHGTNKPGSIGFNASAGCIRMRNKDVEELYDLVDYNTIVHIVNDLNYGPFGYGLRSLRPGDRGADVAEVQKRLKIKGYYDGDIDGIYGEGMKRSLIEFLKANNIPLTDTITDSIYEELGIILMD